MTLHHVDPGPTDAPAVLLGSSLGGTTIQWEAVADRLRDLRCVPFDHRGHGQSPPALGEVTVESMADDVVALADALGLDRFHYAGVSLGGAVGLALALRQPGRLLTVTLACTAAWFGGPDAWEERAAGVRESGMGPLADATAERWFTDEAASTPLAVRTIEALRRQDPRSYAACCGALGAWDARDRLDEVRVPTLLIGAADDPTATPEMVDELERGIHGARRVTVPGRHLAPVGEPSAFAAALRTHLGE